MRATDIKDVIETEGALREVYRPPALPALAKQIDRLDDNCRAFIAHSPFVVVSTAGADGTCDVSPKGGPPGFVVVLDDNRLAFADLSGNNRLDSMQNLIGNPGVALLFLVPGLDETLRVNGRALVTRDPDILERCTVAGVRPRTAFAVEVTEAYIHCAKAFRRAQLWDRDAWPDTSDMPTIACMLREHMDLDGVSQADVETGLEDGYQKTLWKAGGRSDLPT